jgi:MurNAc alpha-1-phosphate uridylyltransferase
LPLSPSPFPLPGSYTFSGIGLYRPSLFANIPRGTKAPLAPLLREQIALGKVSGEHYRGIWVDVGTPQRLDELDKLLRASQNVHHD